MLLTLNIGLLAALTAITAGHFPAGVGFGLFGLLSLVRLRSAAFSIKDVAYTFSALVLALVNGLPERHLVLVVVLNVLVLAAVWLVDDSKTRIPTRVLRLTLDQALVRPEDVRAEVARRLGHEPIAVVVEQVDYKRATLADPETGTRVTIDFGVRGTRDHQAVEVDPGRLIVETKGARTAGDADRLLGQLGARPVSFSKYAASASLMDPRIPDNDVRRMVGRELRVTRIRHQPGTGQSVPARAPQLGPVKTGTTARRSAENLRRTA